MELFIIRDPKRYAGEGYKFPSRLRVELGTLEQALELADYMSNYYAGCDGLFYVTDALEGVELPAPAEEASRGARNVSK